jgi:hypothetical protein
VYKKKTFFHYPSSHSLKPSPNKLQLNNLFSQYSVHLYTSNVFFINMNRTGNLGKGIATFEETYLMTREFFDCSMSEAQARQMLSQALEKGIITQVGADAFDMNHQIAFYESHWPGKIPSVEEWREGRKGGSGYGGGRGGGGCECDKCVNWSGEYDGVDNNEGNYYDYERNKGKPQPSGWVFPGGGYGWY